jgi:hypothetical protein
MEEVLLLIVSCFLLVVGIASCWLRKLRMARRVCLLMGRSWTTRLVRGMLHRRSVLSLEKFRGGCKMRCIVCYISFPNKM